MHYLIHDAAETETMNGAPIDRAKLEIPLDLSEWCPKQALVDWIRAETESLDWSIPETADRSSGRLASQPRSWLCLLVLGYATGNFESEEIVRLCYADETFRSLCPAAFPSPVELGRFRRENRGLLQWLLTAILKRALRARFSLEPGVLPSTLRQFLIETANVRLDIARHVDRAAHGA